MPKYRRATITTPATSKVVNFEFNRNDTFDRRAADAEMSGDPVKTKAQGSGSFELCSGAFTNIYNSGLVAVVEDVAVAAGVETITSRTFTFTKVTSNDGMNANNDGGEGSRKISFEFGGVTET
jgi:hypothetical protein